MWAQSSKISTLLLAAILFSSCGGYDLSTKQIAFIADSTLYVSEADGSSRITLADTVFSFHWLPESNEIEFASKSIGSDTKSSVLSTYRMSMANAHNFYRVGEAKEDTAIVTRNLDNQGLENQVGSFLYTIRNDSLFVKNATGEAQEMLVSPNVLDFSLKK